MSSQDHAPVVIVAGPTASGKSAVALALAKHLGGEVICADSMQVYRDLRVLSARPQVPHHLYGHVDGSERYSAGRFGREAASAIADVRAKGQVPILCGGTGLYLSSIINGLSPIPEVPPEVMEDLRRLWEGDPKAFREHLLTLDPAMERLEPSDQQRHMRAAAVHEVTGRPLSEWQSVEPTKWVEGPVVASVLSSDREVLYGRCDARFEQMLRAGAMEEVSSLKARGLPAQLPVMKALGVPELLLHLDGEITLAEAADSAKRETRRFAKRQLTWFRNQTNWPCFEAPTELISHIVGAVDRV